MFNKWYGIVICMVLNVHPIRDDLKVTFSSLNQYFYAIGFVRLTRDEDTKVKCDIELNLSILRYKNATSRWTENCRTRAQIFLLIA